MSTEGRPNLSMSAHKLTDICVDEAIPATRALIPDGWNHPIPNRAMKICVSLTFLAVDGCGHAQSPVVQPGERDYPVENQNPTKTVQIRIVVPPTLQPIKAVSVFEVQSLGGTMQSGNACAREVGMDTTLPFRLSRPIPLTKNGDGFSGNFSIDQYERGRCGWMFGALGVDVTPKSNQRPFVKYDERQSTPADMRVDVWCVQDPHLGPPFVVSCSNLKTLAFLSGVISKEFVNSIPADQRGKENDVIKIGPNTRMVSVEYHDLGEGSGREQATRQ
jgi:hypothetical protein